MTPLLYLDLNDAHRMTESSIKAAQEMKISVSVCVLDPAGHVICLARMDGASFQTPDVAKGKALTSAMMKKASGIIETATLERLSFTSFNDGRLPIQGGLPVFSGDQLVGSIGISGGTPFQDETIAKVGVNAF
ncbi:heme-binding protein [Erwinia sp. S43]|uniref:GlcG/HbpS family heme-binding protein n=1 Tax=Erwinia sp. S43 TaxID=2769339 RepID=UPI0019096A87|nr:heme-binding protein [Erwinia sp. S43]MBK0031013.1 heme-binding protein [Erwinia sp. S43]